MKIKNLINSLLLFCVLAPHISFASMERDIDDPGLPEQKLPLVPLQKAEEIISEMKNIPESDFPEKIKVTKKEFQNILASQKDFCEGKIDPTKKLSSQEKKVCLQKLRDLVKVFSDELIKNQKRFMNFIHQKNEKALDLTSKSIENEINNGIFNK